MATTCRIHRVSLHRTHGNCPGCEAEQFETMARAARAQAETELRNANECSQSILGGPGYGYHTQAAADQDEIAADFRDRAAALWRDLVSIQRLDKLGPHSHERCPHDDAGWQQHERDRREDETAARWIRKRE